MSLVAILWVFNVTSRIQFVTHSPQENKRPIVTAAMMIAGRTGHVDNHGVVEHCSISFRNAVEFLCHICDLFQMQFFDLHSRLESGPAVRRTVFLQMAEGVDGVGETEFRIFNTQRVRAQGDDIRQTSDQRPRWRFRSEIRCVQREPSNRSDRTISASAHEFGL